MEQATLYRKISTNKTDLVPGEFRLPLYLQHLNFDLKRGSHFKLAPKVDLVVAPEVSIAKKIEAGEVPTEGHSWLLARKRKGDHWHGHEIELVPSGKGNFKVFVYRSSGNCIAMGKASFAKGQISFSMEFNNRRLGNKHHIKGIVDKNFQFQLERDVK